jgi:hypothetical protein
MTHRDDRPHRPERRDDPAWCDDASRRDARERIADAPLSPDIRALRAVRETEGLPTAIGDVLVVDASITEGRPEHGALRSDAHLSALEVVVPIAAVRGDGRHEVPRGCPECGHTRARYSYSAHHHIAGSAAVTCAVCGHEHDAETWG